MQTFIGAKLLSSKLAQPAQKPFEIYDSRLSGFTLRVQPTGVRSYYARFGRSRRIALGKVGAVLPDEARERCQKVLGNVAHGRHPLHGLGGDGLTLGQFIAETYEPWVKANRPRGATNTVGKLNRLFGTWFAEPLSTITIERIESWKIRRLNTGRTATTVLRDIFTLSSVQAGVPLNTVRDLLGHNSVAMSLRYAHLAPDQRREAVAKLNVKPLLALTMRLQWNQGSILQRLSTPLIVLVVREGLEPSTSAL